MLVKDILQQIFENHNTTLLKIILKVNKKTLIFFGFCTNLIKFNHFITSNFVKNYGKASSAIFTITVFTSVKFFNPYSPPSLPNPEFLNPPNGI